MGLLGSIMNIIGKGVAKGVSDIVEKKDTVDGKPVVMLYREVALGNHPPKKGEAIKK